MMVSHIQLTHTYGWRAWAGNELISQRH